MRTGEDRSKGDVYYEAWEQPRGEGTRLDNEPRGSSRHVLTKPKILPVAIEWERVEEATGRKRKRYVLSAATYQRLIDAVPQER